MKAGIWRKHNKKSLQSIMENIWRKWKERKKLTRNNLIRKKDRKEKESYSELKKSRLIGKKLTKKKKEINRW